MKVFYPDYFKEFRCLSGDCPDSCCKEWAVDIDPESAAFYRSLPGDLGNRIRSFLSEEDGCVVMTIQNGRCPMWRQDGLCEIQAQLGHDALCKTCREFPRLTHDYGDFTEYGLELSCPEAARLILGSNRHHLEEASVPDSGLAEYDPEIMGILQQSRQAVLDFLDKGMPLGQSLAAILLYGHFVQSALDGDCLNTTPEACLDQVDRFRGQGDLAAIWGFFRELEILTEDWRHCLAQVPDTVVWSDALRGMARYLVQRYWLQTICDLDLVCRVKLIAVSCLVVGALPGDVVRGAQLYSKEIENDPDNVEAILDGAYHSPALTDKNLLALLCR